MLHAIYNTSCQEIKLATRFSIIIYSSPFAVVRVPGSLCACRFVACRAHWSQNTSSTTIRKGRTRDWATDCSPGMTRRGTRARWCAARGWAGCSGTTNADRRPETGRDRVNAPRCREDAKASCRRFAPDHLRIRRLRSWKLKYYATAWIYN